VKVLRKQLRIIEKVNNKEKERLKIIRGSGKDTLEERKKWAKINLEE